MRTLSEVSRPAERLVRTRGECLNVRCDGQSRRVAVRFPPERADE